MSDNDTFFLTRRQQARRYGVSTRSIERWANDPDLGFPLEIDIAGRKFRKLADLNWTAAVVALALNNIAVLRALIDESSRSPPPSARGGA